MTIATMQKDEGCEMQSASGSELGYSLRRNTALTKIMPNGQSTPTQLLIENTRSRDVAYLTYVSWLRLRYYTH